MTATVTAATTFSADVLVLLVGFLVVTIAGYTMYRLNKFYEKNMNSEPKRIRIFISSPYNHPNKDVIADRVKKTAEYCGMLFKEGKTALSPIMMGTKLLEYVELPTDAATWEKFSLDTLEGCSEMHVLMLDKDWTFSTGIKYEIAYAQKYNIPIKYIEF